MSTQNYGAFSLVSHLLLNSRNFQLTIKCSRMEIPEKWMWNVHSTSHVMDTLSIHLFGFCSKMKCVQVFRQSKMWSIFQYHWNASKWIKIIHWITSLFSLWRLFSRERVEDLLRVCWKQWIKNTIPNIVNRNFDGSVREVCDVFVSRLYIDVFFSLFYSVVAVVLFIHWKLKWMATTKYIQRKSMQWP